MHVLVTGGCGFVGSHIATAHNAGSHRVSILDRAALPTDASMIRMDLRDSTPATYESVDTIIHCAAHADISRNWIDGLHGVYTDNIEATWAMLSAAGKCERVRRVVFISTAAVYGGGGPHVEAEPCLATSPYVASKLAGEAMVQAWAEKHGWTWYCARLVGCVGLGYPHGHIKDFVRMAKTHGVIRALDDGQQRKTMVHVKDASDALWLMANGQIDPGIYNVASDDVWSWRDTVAIMGGVSVEYEPKQGGWIGDPINLRVSNAKLRRAGWEPVRTIAQGVREALGELGWDSSR